MAFRDKIQTEEKEDVLPSGSTSSSAGEIGTDKVEVPFTDYHKVHGKPFVAEYYQLGETWDDPSGGFSKEISLIDEFFDNQIESGRLPNSVSSVKKAISKIEKTINISDDERPLSRIEKLAAYVRFLMECDHINFNLARYGK